jgi:two-component system, chemotaxis family, CheB/CheR fusion protein
LTDDLRVVGIGASAGGIEALRGFFQSMPARNRLAFIVMLHLSPDRTSMLAEVLGRWTAMPVEQATEGVVVAAEHVYVIAPNTLMTIEGGCLHLRAPTSPMRENTPIDIFFTSLAADCGPRAIGVVLSGTGSDGALGLKAIKQAGGVSLVQGGDGSGPQYPGMPASAIATGAVDLILPVDAMPEHILRLEARPESQAAQADTAGAEISEARPEICGILRNRVGHDFSGYKEQTFVRRVQRRMQFIGLGLQDYVQRLRTDPGEVELLFHDLLIGVTTFFRDVETFDALAQTVLPQLFDGKSADNTVRVWVPGCATGEEAYSLAILLREHMAKLPAPPAVQIFATDIDEAAIAVARSGRYPTLLLKDVSPARLDRYFTASDGTCQVRKELRDLCTFSAHSVIRDPPFSRIDLISCRNLLIYLDTDLQARVIPAFHYALAPSGYLLLGGSEMVTRHGELFTPVDKRHRIFQRRDAPSSLLQFSPLTTPSRLVPKPSPRRRDSAAGWSSAAQAANDRILERYAPPFVVVNAEGTVLHFSARTGRYLEPAPGVPSRELVSMARRGLRLELRAALRQALETGETVERHRVNVELNGATQPIILTVEPLPARDADRLFMVVFSDAGAAREPEDAAAETHPAPSGAADQFEHELVELREQLQSTVEEYETALEELKSANEELQSVNEEMQSTNEELETSKEEIQSMNEELQTVNAQLTAKVDELDHANSDLRNLFESTQVATIFLDRFMVVRGFTPAVAGIYNLIPSDRGRSLDDIASQVDYGDLRPDVRRVLDTLAPFERRVTRHDGSTHYLMRILPYRTADDRVDGALITFVDVTSMVQAEQHHRLMVDELNHRVRNMLTVVISLATRTLRQSKSLPEFSEAFLGRVNALSTAYTLLSRDNWTEVSLRDVLLAELRPFMAQARDNISLSGSLVALKPRGALALGMVVHELVTNAVKYGALSVPDGKVAIHWHVEPTAGSERLICQWNEQDGPPIEPPGRHGFGLSMIERSLRHELKGETKFLFEPAGLLATLIIPLDPAIASRADAREARQ